METSKDSEVMLIEPKEAHTVPQEDGVWSIAVAHGTECTELNKIKQPSCFLDTQWLDTRVLLERLRVYMCEECKKMFYTFPQLVRHTSVHKKYNPRRYLCRICGTRFRYCFQHANHQCVHTEERPFPCDLCEFSFISNFHLKRHQQLHTKETMPLVPSQLNSDVKSESEPPIVPPNSCNELNSENNFQLMLELRQSRVLIDETQSAPTTLPVPSSTTQTLTAFSPQTSSPPFLSQDNDIFLETRGSLSPYPRSPSQPDDLKLPYPTAPSKTCRPPYPKSLRQTFGNFSLTSPLLKVRMGLDKRKRKKQEQKENDNMLVQEDTRPQQQIIAYDIEVEV